MRYNRPILEILAIARLFLLTLCTCGIARDARAQQVQFPSTTGGTPWSPPANTGSQLFPSAPPAGSGWAAVGTMQPTYTNSPNPAVPSATSPNVTYGPATVTPIGPPYTGYNPYPGNPNTGIVPNNGIYPNSAPPALFPSNSGLANPYSTGMGASNSLYSNSLFDANNWRLGNGWFNNGTTPVWNNNPPDVIRFFQGARFRHTWVAGGDQDDDLGINDSDVSVALAFPKFFGSSEPLYVVPSFSSHLWDGPSTSFADLPPAAYSAFLDGGWQTDPIRTFGLETGIRLGVFTDYNTFNSESFRIMGKILGRVRITPTAVGRIGAYWLDRNRIKLLPAVGITWTPNPDTRFDLFFPEPKLAHYLATFGRTDMWWYGTGYLGGGAWTITRADGSEDNIDINDIRIALGLEFGRNDLIRAGQRTAFVEAGYAFNRELIYRIRPQDNLDLQDSFVLRAGFGY